LTTEGRVGGPPEASHVADRIPSAIAHSAIPIPMKLQLQRAGVPEKRRPAVKTLNATAAQNRGTRVRAEKAAPLEAGAAAAASVYTAATSPSRASRFSRRRPASRRTRIMEGILGHGFGRGKEA
jgi:hypothetical protein